MGNMMDELGVLGGGGPNNSRFGAGGVNLIQGATADQANQTYGEAQAALAQQQALANALQGQGAQGIATQSQLTQALQQQALGQGPNPAQAALAQSTGANIANQAALMAGQRGAGANTGLIAREAAQQGAGLQQQAAGQGATLQAQQQLAAQQQLQGLAGTQIGQQANAVSGYNQAAQGLQGNILNSIAGQNAANVGMQSNMNNANSAMAQTNANNAAKVTGGLFQGASALGGTMVGGLAHGGMIEKGPQGFYKSNPKLEHVSAADRMPMPEHLKGMAEIYHPGYAYGGPVQAMGVPAELGSPNAIGNASPVDMSLQKKPAAKADPLDQTKNVQATDMGMGSNAMAGGAADVGSPVAIGAEAGGGAEGIAGAVAANPELLALASKGAYVPGKAKVKGDSQKNDTVPAMLSAGEIVIPRHITQGDNAPEKAAEFVRQLLAKHGKSQGEGKEEDDFKSALKNAVASRKK